MLTTLLRAHLRPYRRALAVVVAFQAVQALAALYLPALNARIIDRGVVSGDRAFIWRTGGVMVAVTLVQIGFSVAAVYAGARAAMGFGREIGRAHV